MRGITNSVGCGNYNNRLALGFWPSSQIHRHLEGGPRTWTDHNTLSVCEFRCPLDRFGAGRAQELTDMSAWSFFIGLIGSQLREEVRWDACTDAEDGMRRMCRTKMHARLGRFNANDLAFWILLNEVLANTSSSTSCADTSDKIVNIFARLLPYLRPCGLVVDLRIRFIVKLICKEERVYIFGNKFLSVDLHARQPLDRGGEMNIRSKHAANNVPFLKGRELRHDDDALVTLGRADHGDADAGVSAGVLDDGHSWL
mmetsp:Transcript_11477/g.21256  ORF Transcript_11477/g.21256 Transcript_11477/m.21256 type:complete len:256 (+) Transcript_11477:547-1314(+)